MDFANALLSETVSSGNATHVRAMLAAGADPNQTSQGGQTPLILAIVSGNLHLVNLLLDAGADPSQRDHTGLNAIEWAERKGYPDIAKALQNPSSGRGRISVPRTPARPIQPETSNITQTARDQSLTPDEKSRRWIAGLKQRLDEKADRQRNESPSEPISNIVTEATNVPIPETKRRLDEKADRQRNVSLPEPTPTVVTEATNVPVPKKSVQAVPETIVEEPSHLPNESVASEISTNGSAKKRCPQCNTVYDSPLIAYCAYHVVALVDLDAPDAPPPPPLPKAMTPLLWVLILVTFTAASFAAYLIIAPLYNSRKQEALPAAAPAPPNTSGKGVPVVSGDLSGKALVIPDVYSPSKLTEQVTVVVRVKVDKKGQVISAQPTGGDEQLQEAVLKSARKAEFSTDNLGARGTQGTITYMFKP